MVAHEFNNILTTIVSYAQLAKKNPKMVGKALDHAASGGTRAACICGALLGAARGGTDVRRRVVLDELVSETLDAMARRPERDCIEMSIDIPSDLDVVTRPLELQQVLLNLLINARNSVMASEGSRNIEVSASKKQDEVVISISDNGMGIAEDRIGKVFQPFYSTRAGEETANRAHGLGLAFCKRIVGELGGDINVSSVLGKGATFTIHIPV